MATGVTVALIAKSPPGPETLPGRRPDGKNIPQASGAPAKPTGSVPGRLATVRARRRDLVQVLPRGSALRFAWHARQGRPATRVLRAPRTGVPSQAPGSRQRLPARRLPAASRL